MKLSSKELKQQARGALNGRYLLPMSAFIIAELLVSTANLPFSFPVNAVPNLSQILISFLASMIIALLSIVLSCGLMYIHLNLARNTDTNFFDLFFFFTNRPDRFILASILFIGILVLAMIPAIVVTVAAILLDSSIGLLAMIVIWIISCIFICILSLSYSLIYYLLIDQPDMGILEVFQQSRSLMKGNKSRLLYICFSFLGMSFLSILSFGLGLLWVTPYMNQTNVEFYRNVIGELDIENDLEKAATPL